MARSSESIRMTIPAHLSKFEQVILQGGEWKLAAVDWVILQLSEGVAYAFDCKASLELPQGGVIVCPPKSEVTLTASVLGRVVFRGMAIRINSLAGFLTALERQCLETEVARQCAPFLALPADHALARRLTLIFTLDQALTLSNRLAFAQSFAELVTPQLCDALNKGRESEKNQQEVKVRMRQFISQIPESELPDLSLGALAKQLHCCERHASRLFREEWGIGFIPYVSEIRLKKACHLLLQKNLKIIDVALESGHGSLAHFNYVFKKRFHMTPTDWREGQTAPPRRPPRPKALPMAAAAVVVWLLLSVAGNAVGRDSVEPSLKNPITTNQPAAAVTNTVVTNTAVATNTVVTNTAPQAPIIYKLDRFEVLGNTLLTTNVISNVLAPYLGEGDMDQFIAKITNGMGALQMEYFRRGWFTVKVTFPPQKPTNGVVLLQVTEGKLSAVRITHNRFYSSNSIMRALPYVQSLESREGILNTNLFQSELDRANANPDRQIMPEVREGLEAGTSALVLDVQDRLPLHGRLEWDNYSPPGTPELRVNANASYGNLWQLDHTLGLQYGFSPELMKPTLGEGTHVSLNPMDAPEVSYYSGFYRMPFGSPAAVEEQIAQDPNHFGYNETTKQFVQPTAIGRPEFTAYASRSTTGPTMFGPRASIVNDTNLQIQQQLITQQYTSQTTAGGRLNFPLPTWQGIQSSWSFGMDYKEDKVVTLPTNYFYSTTFVKEGNNPDSPVVRIPSTIAVEGVMSYPSLQYTPFFLGWSGWRQDHWGQGGVTNSRWSQFDAGLSLGAGTGGTFSRARPFPFLIANSKEATTEFIAVRPQLSRTQVLPDNFTFYGSMTGQWANEPLLNLEQFELGGNGSVRGYREGELYADTGWVVQVELRSPFFWRGTGWRLGTQITAFTDYGEGYQLDQAAAQRSDKDLWGAGVGVNFKLGPYVESHILIAWPLLNSAYSVAGHERISFSLSAQL